MPAVMIGPPPIASRSVTWNDIIGAIDEQRDVRVNRAESEILGGGCVASGSASE